MGLYSRNKKINRPIIQTSHYHQSFQKDCIKAGKFFNFVYRDSMHLCVGVCMCVCAPLQLVLCVIASLPPAWNIATSLVPLAPSSTSKHVGTHAGSDPRSGASIPSSSPPCPHIDTCHWMMPSAAATCEWMTQSNFSKLWKGIIWLLLSIHRLFKTHIKPVLFPWNSRKKSSWMGCADYSWNIVYFMKPLYMNHFNGQVHKWFVILGCWKLKLQGIPGVSFTSLFFPITFKVFICCTHCMYLYIM